MKTHKAKVKQIVMARKRRRSKKKKKSKKLKGCGYFSNNRYNTITEKRNNAAVFLIDMILHMPVEILFHKQEKNLKESGLV